ncbi:hypothetical protein GWK47_026867 [Chionoecetes opilio]|uniref:Uncharacterized protein n=1 Tax=Chionoecetes opilio TaxID=41210 RepID=A0A8J8WAJ4_CHIOP|nr:hypothetical protein GWK47_026867 [Chionoecetes opilio]
MQDRGDRTCSGPLLVCVECRRVRSERISIATAEELSVGMVSGDDGMASEGDGVVSGGDGVVSGGDGVVSGGNGVVSGGDDVVRGVDGVVSGSKGVVSGGESRVKESEKEGEGSRGSATKVVEWHLIKSILEAIENLKRCFVSEVNELKSVVKKQEIEIRSLKCGGGGSSGVSGGAHARDVPGGVTEGDVPRAITKGGVPSKSPGIGGWKVVDHGRARPKERKVNNDHVVCTNSFQVLSRLQQEDKEVKTVDDTSLPEGKILVVGDSQFRHLDSRFCDRKGMRMKSVSYPGKGIGYVSDKIVECMADQGKKPIVCLSAGGNDVECVTGLSKRRSTRPQTTQHGSVTSQQEASTFRADNHQYNLIGEWRGLQLGGLGIRGLWLWSGGSGGLQLGDGGGGVRLKGK